MKALRLLVLMLGSVLACGGEVFFGGVQPRTREAVTVVAYTAYTVGYSEQRRVPLWSVYTVDHTQDEPQAVSRKGFPFFTEPATLARVTRRDYAGSGYSRGHMTPFAAIACAFGAEAARETFSMANMVPQLQAHNAGIWAELEDAVTGVRSPGGFRPGLTRQTARIWVYTGPVLEAAGATIGARRIAVPTALWKAAVWFTPAGQTHACAWIIPHDPDLDRHRWKEFATTLGSVETRAGVTLVPGDPGQVMERCDADEAVAAWP